LCDTLVVAQQHRSPREGEPLMERVAYVRMTPDEHERLHTFAARRHVSASEAAREILRERLANPLLTPGAVSRRRNA
jgi:hypothetical protein